MRTADRYTFVITATSQATGQSETFTVHPQYGGMKMKYAKEDGEVYYTQELDGSFTLVGEDYDTIAAYPLRTKFKMTIYDFDGTVAAEGSFRRTDAKIDADHKTYTFSVNAEDRYTRLIDGRDNEYNLVDIPGMEKQDVNLLDRPVVQLYMNSSTKAYNFNSLSRTEVDVEPTDSITNIQDWFDDQCIFIGGLRIHNWHGYSAWEGNYTFYSYTTSPVPMFRFKNVLDDSKSVTLYNDSISLRICDFKISLEENEDIKDTITYLGDQEKEWIDSLVTLNVKTIGDKKIYFNVKYSGIRILTNTNPDSHYPLNDPLKGRYDYRYDVTMQGANLFSCGKVTSTPTTYGKVEYASNVYYDSPGEGYLPILHDMWSGGISYWVKDDVSQYISAQEEETYTNTTTVHDFYRLGQSIKAVLNEIDPSVVFEEDVEHSQFLFASTNPVTGQQQGTMFISQKSNILELTYDYPAWKAPIKFSQIEELLRYAFNCYCEIYDEEGVRHMRIEHILYYLNGHSYYQDENTTLDLTKETDIRNRKPLSFHTSKWSYKNSSMPTRVEFSWMDTQSDMFSGEPMLTPDEYNIFEKDTTERRQISWFSTDIDFILSVSQECSSDGFALVEALQPLPFPIYTVVSGSYMGRNGVQNYRLSMAYLERNYLLYDAQSARVIIGDDTYDIPNSRVARMRTGEVSFITPTGHTADPSKIIVTEAGEGVVETMEVDMTSGLVSATLMYENEE